MSDEERKQNYYASLELWQKLHDYAEKEKRKHLAGSAEQAYWQGTADAMRKIGSTLLGHGMYTDLYRELENDRA